MHYGQLRSFLATARAGSLSRAAKSEHLATQSLAQRIDSLETELGFRLFFRTTKGMELTPAGHEFAAAVTNALKILDQGIANASIVAEQAHKTLRVGITWRTLPLFQSLCVDYQKNNEGILVECLQTLNETMLSELADDVFDLALAPVGKLGISGIQSRRIYDGEFQCVFSPDDDLATLDEIHPGDLIGKKVLLGYGVDCRITKDFRFVEDWPDNITIVSDPLPGEEVVLRCLRNEGWVALFSTGTAPLVCPPLSVRRLADSPPYPISIYYCNNADPVALDFIDYIVEGYRKAYMD